MIIDDNKQCNNNLLRIITENLVNQAFTKPIAGAKENELHQSVCGSNAFK